MNTTRTALVGLALLGLTTVSRPAHADATLFGGLDTSPRTRATLGVALGLSRGWLGLEFEYAHTLGDDARPAPSLRTGSFVALVQTPTRHRFRLYVAAGAGLYRARHLARRQGGVAANLGGGVTVPIAGPIRLRVDYRRFVLRGSGLVTSTHRGAMGAVLAF